MHQDHGQSPAVCMGAIRSGFSSVMMDGSLQADGKTIASYDYNVDVTRKVVEMAHGVGVTVEGELGCLGSLETMKGDKEDGHGAEGTMTREMLLTDPEQAADFVKRTQLDALAKPGAILDENVYVGPRCLLGLVRLEKDVLLAGGVQVPSGGMTHHFDDPTVPIKDQGGERTLVTEDLT